MGRGGGGGGEGGQVRRGNGGGGDGWATCDATNSGVGWTHQVVKESRRLPRQSTERRTSQDRTAEPREGMGHPFDVSPSSWPVRRGPSRRRWDRRGQRRRTVAEIPGHRCRGAEGRGPRDCGGLVGGWRDPISHPALWGCHTAQPLQGALHHCHQMHTAQPLQGALHHCHQMCVTRRVSGFWDPGEGEGENPVSRHGFERREGRGAGAPAAGGPCTRAPGRRPGPAAGPAHRRAPPPALKGGPPAGDAHGHGGS